MGVRGGPELGPHSNTTAHTPSKEEKSPLLLMPGEHGQDRRPYEVEHEVEA
jgi:hypothetical protein